MAAISFMGCWSLAFFSLVSIGAKVRDNEFVVKRHTLTDTGRFKIMKSSDIWMVGVKLCLNTIETGLNSADR